MSDALSMFAAEVRRPDAELDLGRAALLIAAAEYPDLSIETCVSLLDVIADGVAAITPPDASPRAIAHAVRRRLFHDLDFQGSEGETYADPRNSYLNDVLLRRTGIPISLSTVFLEVARRVGLDAAGVAYPQHFLVKYQDEGEEWIVDPFHRGEEFSGRHFRAHIRRRAATPERLLEYYLAAVTRRQLLTRMLTNLKMLYAESEDHARSLRIQEYLLTLSPWSFPDIRDRGVLRGKVGDIDGALTDLETYLAHAGPAGDRAEVAAQIARLKRTR